MVVRSETQKGTLINPPVEISEHELSTLIFWAFRYTLGRRTYSVSDVSEAIVKFWPRIQHQTKALIRKEIMAARDVYGGLGDKCDESRWMAIMELPFEDK